MNPNSMTNERLCTLAQKGDEAAWEILVEKNMGFIVQTADLIYRSSSLEGSDLNIDVDDLVQEGSIGLLRAVDGFDPARKLKFLTYAAPAIKNAMLDLVHTAQMSFEHRMATVKVKDGVEGLGLERVYLDEILPSDERLLRIEAIADPYALSPEEAFIKAETSWLPSAPQPTQVIFAMRNPPKMMCNRSCVYSVTKNHEQIYYTISHFALTNRLQNKARYAQQGMTGIQICRKACYYGPIRFACRANRI